MDVQQKPVPDQKLSKKIKELYFNLGERKKSKYFRDILQHANVENVPQVMETIRSTVEKSIKQTVDRISDIQYFIMEKSNSWGEYGQQRVVIGYARLKLGILPESEITQSDIDRFVVMMNKNIEYKAMTLENLRKLDKEETFDVLGRKIKVHRSDLINRELRFLESRNRISVGKYGSYQSMIYGLGKNQRKEGYDIILFEKELARTPTNIMSIAAVIGTYDIGIRTEACNLIYAMKWKKMFEYTDNEKRCMYNNEAGNIREMIKVRALEAYKINGIEDVETKRTLFVDEMIEGILWHEFGHGIFFNSEIPIEESARGKAFSTFGENIVCILHEVLADWAPRKDKLKGPIQHFLEVAVKDPDKANRMLLVYMSDNWFLDFKEEFLGTQTDLMISVLMPFLRPDATFDFDRLREKYDEIYQFMNTKSQDVIDGVVEFLQKAKYKPYKELRDFNYMEQEVHRILQKSKDNIGEEENAYRTTFWLNMITYCKNFSPNTYRDILNYLKQKEKSICKDLVALIAPDQTKYQANIRDYLFEQIKDKGFYKAVSPLTTLDGVRMSLDQIGVFETEKEKVFNQFKSIIDNQESKKITINYDDSFNFFNCAIQEVLLSTQLGEIDRENVVLNDKLVMLQHGQANRNVDMDTIKAKIDELAEMFIQKKILSISMLKVNIAHEPIDVWYKLLAEKQLPDGSLLIQKIDYVTGENMDAHVISKYRVPVEYGYMCFNTVNAINKVNDLLKDDTHSKDVIDKGFLDFIMFEYNNTY